MRIVKVHEYYTGAGGEDTVFHAERDLLRENGHEIIEYLEFNKKIESMHRASVALQTVWSSSSYRKIKHFLERTNPAIVHFHNIFPLISPSAYYACQELNIPVVQTLDNQRLICPAASFYRNGRLCTDCIGKTPPWPGIVHACYHDSRLHTGVVSAMLTFHRWVRTWQIKVDAYLCSTAFYRDLFVESGLRAEKISVMPHFVQPDHQLSREEREEYALFVGRLDPEKGVYTLLESWRRVDITLKIRGEGRLEKDLRAYVKQHKMDNVQFLGRLEEDELSNLIRNARFLVMPSEGYYETFGMVIIEAYARRTPVLASNIGVAPELVEDKVSGLLFEPGNPIDLAEKAKWMWEHPKEISKMGENGFLAYKDKYTPERCYDTLISVYEAAIMSK